MPQLFFQLADGSTRSVTGGAGDTVMQVATYNALPGIEAVCGGFCNCATCHVYVAAEWVDKVTPISEAEDEMLDGTAAERLPGSRLACQLTLSEEQNGLAIRMPERQA